MSTSNFLNNIGINPPIIAPTIIFINNDIATTKTILISFININAIIDAKQEAYFSEYQTWLAEQNKLFSKEKHLLGAIFQ